MSPSSVAVAAPLFRAAEHVSGSLLGGVVRRVWERSQEYEDEGSERRSLGAVSVGVGAWWSASLTVPADEPSTDGEAVFLRFERRGTQPAGYRGGTQADFSVPRSEVEAFVTLLAGLIEQARQDGVLARRPP